MSAAPTPAQPQTVKQPTYFISHGGGPWPWMPEMRSRFAALEQSLAAMPGDLPAKPSAILMASGHWETGTTQVMSHPAPPMVYDYYNFPPHTYEVTYPAPGAPALADKTRDLIAAAGIEVSLNPEQGYDHGVFTPMEVMYPAADMPLYQVSIGKDYDPAAHLALGRALAPLRDEGVLIVGSGLSYHNLRMMGPEAAVPSAEFDAWLGEALKLNPEARRQAMLDWEKAPSARVAHKEEDHLVPLWVALGAAESGVVSRTYHESELFGSITASSYRFD